MRISGIVGRSRVNGPGERVLLAVQGCSLRCPGCINKDLWNPEGGNLVEVVELMDLLHLLRGPKKGTRGLTISGAEPFDQPNALRTLLRTVEDWFTDTIVFTGYTVEQLLEDNSRAACMPHIDALITGPYQQENRSLTGLRGSTNQKIVINHTSHLDEKTLEQFQQEIEIHDGGIVTGFPG